MCSAFSKVMEEQLSKPKHKSKLTPTIAVVGVIGIFFVAQIIGINVMAIGGLMLGVSQDQLTSWLSDNIAIQSLALIVITVIGLGAVHLLLNWTHTSWQAIGLKKPVALDVGRAIIGYGWYLLLFLATMAIVGQFAPTIDVDQQQQLGFDRSTTGGLALLLIGISLVLLPAFYEEVLMRGVLFTGLRSKLPFIATAIIVSIIFAAAHLEWGSGVSLNWAAAIDTGILALVLVYLRETSKSLWPAIFLHGIKNLIAFTLVFVLKVS